MILAEVARGRLFTGPGRPAASPPGWPLHYMRHFDRAPCCPFIRLSDSSSDGRRTNAQDAASTTDLRDGSEARTRRCHARWQQISWRSCNTTEAALPSRARQRRQARGRIFPRSRTRAAQSLSPCPASDRTPRSSAPHRRRRIGPPAGPPPLRRPRRTGAPMPRPPLHGTAARRSRPGQPAMRRSAAAAQCRPRSPSGDEPADVMPFTYALFRVRFRGEGTAYGWEPSPATRP